MLLLIGIILLISASSDWAAAKDWEESERRADERHEEYLERLGELTEYRPDPPRQMSHKRHRRFIQDEEGKIIGEEVEEWYD